MDFFQLNFSYVDFILVDNVRSSLYSYGSWGTPIVNGPKSEMKKQICSKCKTKWAKIKKKKLPSQCVCKKTYITHVWWIEAIRN